MNDYRPNRGFGFLSNTPPVVKNLILINIIMYVATLLFPEFMYSHFALYYFDSPLFKPYQFITHMFMHSEGLLHILFNMYALWMFGRALEMVWGGQRFFIFYFVTGLGAAALHTLVLWIQMSQIEAAIDPSMLVQLNQWLTPDVAADISHKIIANLEVFLPNVFSTSSAHEWVRMMIMKTVGASGAVYGVLLGFGMLFPTARLQLIFPPISMTAKWFVIIFGVIELTLGFTNTGGGIAHFAHVGGMLFGFILIKLWNRPRRQGPYQR